jgi:putative cell wall-binding protein
MKRTKKIITVSFVVFVSLAACVCLDGSYCTVIVLAAL